MVDQLVGITLSGCKIIKLLGKGGMGSVFLGRQVDLGRFVAVKILSKNLIQEEGFLRRFKREARSVASLSHPNIVQVYQYGEEDGIHFIVMEYIEGDTLGAKLVEGPIDEQEAIKIAKESALALAAAHEKKIVHRDIKPDNIILSKLDETKVTDFGLAKQLSGGDQASLVTKQIIGTPAYISPEQIKGAPIDPRSDLYSLGATLYHAVSGKPPFSAKNPFELLEKHLKEKPTPPIEIREEVSPEINDVILKCLEKDPKFRYQSPEELIEDLERLEKGEKPIATRRGVSFAWPMKALMAAALVAVIAWAGSQFFKSPPDDPGTNGGTIGPTAEELDRQYQGLLKEAMGYLDAKKYELALRTLEQAQTKKDSDTIRAQIRDVKDLWEKKKAAEAAAENLETLRKTAMASFLAVAASDSRTVRQVQKAIADIGAVLAIESEDDEMTGWLAKARRWEHALLHPDQVPDGGGTNPNGGTPAVVLPPDAGMARPALVTPPPLDYVSERPDGPPDRDEGESPPDEGGEDDEGDEGDEAKDPFADLPEPEFEADIFLRNGQPLLDVTVLEIDLEGGRMIIRHPGGGKQTCYRGEVGRVEVDDDSIGRVKGIPIQPKTTPTAVFAVPAKDTSTGHIQVVYDFADAKQKDDWKLTNAAFNPLDRSVRLGNKGEMELNPKFQKNVQVDLRLTPVGKTQGRLQILIYNENLTLSTSRREPPAISKEWDLPGNTPWPEDFPEPSLQPDMPSWVTVRRIDKQIYLNVNYITDKDGNERDIWMPGEIEAGVGNIAFRAVGGTFVIEEVKITGTPW